MRRVAAVLLAPFWLVGAVAASLATLCVMSAAAVAEGWRDSYRLPATGVAAALLLVAAAVAVIVVL